MLLFLVALFDEYHIRSCARDDKNKLYHLSERGVISLIALSLSLLSVCAIIIAQVSCLPMREREA